MILLLMLALSVDCFGAGLSYGLQKIRFPWYNVFFVGGCSGMALLLSMALATVVGQWISTKWINGLGAVLLILLGGTMLRKSIWSRKTCIDETETVLQWKIPLFGVIIQILKEPKKADLDHSGQISCREALCLGIALSLDASCAGLALAFAEYSPFFPGICVAVSSCLAFLLGLHSGQWFDGYFSRRSMQMIPGVILILLGLLRFGM